VLHVPKAIEWYRPAMTRRMLRIVLPCSLLTLTAALLIGGGVLVRDGGWSATLVIVGVLFAIAGPTIAAYGVLKFLKHDVYLSLRTDGVQFHDEEGCDSFIRWSDLEEAASPDPGTLELRPDNGGAPLIVKEQFIGIANADLAARIAELHRKALLGVPLR